MGCLGSVLILGLSGPGCSLCSAVVMLPFLHSAVIHPNVSILTLSGARSCDTRIWHLSYVLEHGILGGTVAAAAISEGAPPK